MSVQDFSDEIIVVDDFSTDETSAICKRYNATCIKNKFIDFAAQKNVALDMASFPFVFSIDADEEVSQTLKQSIMAVKEHAVADFYSLNRCTNYIGKWIRYSGWYPDKKIRLWKKDSARWTGAVHEVLIPAPKNVKHLKGDLLHYSYPTLRWHVEKINHFTEIAATQMHAQGKRASWLKIIFSMQFNFIKKYVLQRGFLDGYHGFLLALLSSYYTLLKYAKLRHLQSSKTKSSS